MEQWLVRQMVWVLPGEPSRHLSEQWLVDVLTLRGATTVRIETMIRTVKWQIGVRIIEVLVRYPNKGQGQVKDKDQGQGQGQVKKRKRKRSVVPSPM